MGSNSDPGQPDLREIVRQIQDLERRFRALEQRVYRGAIPPAQFLPPRGATPRSAADPAHDTVKALPVFGRALLAIAGAYLLRALTEFKAVPLTAGVFAGIIYALAWLVLAARAAGREPFVGAVRAATSALILAPLLWEATVRYQALSTSTAAVVIVVFSSFGFAVSWRNNLTIIAWTTTLAGLLAAIALLMATHDLVPFTLALLVMAAVVESSACFGHWLRERWIMALVSDLAVLLLTYIAARATLPEGYASIAAVPAFAAVIALPAIYLASTSVRALWCRASLTAFETVQIGLAIVLSMSGVLRLSHGAAAAQQAVAISGLVCGAAFYVLSVAFGRDRKRSRNLYTYSTLGLLLVVACSQMQFSGTALAVVLSALGLASLSLGRSVFRWHAAVYLLFSSVISGLSGWAAARLLGTQNGWAPPATDAWISAAAALLAYAWVRRRPAAWSVSLADRAPLLAIAGICVLSLAGFATAALTAVCASHSAAPNGICAILRTLVLAAAALALAWTGSRWKRPELVWLAYPVLVLIAYKLALQDLPEGHTLPLFASLFLFGGALVWLPRILQKPQ